MKRNLYILIFLSITVLGSLTKLNSMGYLPDISIQDEINVWTFPSLLSEYPNMVYTEILGYPEIAIHINPSDETWGAVGIKIFNFKDNYFSKIGITPPENGVALNYTRSIIDNLKIGIGSKLSVYENNEDSPYLEQKTDYLEFSK